MTLVYFVKFFRYDVNNSYAPPIGYIFPNCKIRDTATLEASLILYGHERALY